MTEKLTKLDESLLGIHAKIRAEDEIYFWREYTSGRDYTFGPGNDLISNLKKKPGTSSGGEIYHKNRVMQECADFFRKSIREEWLSEAVLIPIPPSKMKTDSGYDDRMTRVCRSIRPIPPLDVREMVHQTQSLKSSHEVGAGERTTVDELLQVYQVDETLAEPQPANIAIFDDVLTAGVHYRAMHTVLSQRFPNARMVGFFIARRVFPNDEAIEDF